jgi:hypothetical protein
MLNPLFDLGRGKTAMSEEQPVHDLRGNEGLIFMLSQLRDDLAELIEGLESRSLPYEVAVEGAQDQLRWVLKELSEG